MSKFHNKKTKERRIRKKTKEKNNKKKGQHQGKQSGEAEEAPPMWASVCDEVAWARCRYVAERVRDRVVSILLEMDKEVVEMVLAGPSLVLVALSAGASCRGNDRLSFTWKT